MTDRPAPDTQRSPFRADLFRDTVVVVTGGGTGIGRAIARELASLGARIALCGRRVEPLETFASELRATGTEVFTQTCDIRDTDRVTAFVDGVLGAFGRIDALVNNAGGQFPSPATNISPKGFEAVVRNNLLGTYNFTHAVATRAMIPAKGGRIVNIIALINRGFPGMAHTGAARAGVDNLTKSLAVEWAPYQIQINAIAPGYIRSTGIDQYPPDLAHRAEQQTPARRLGSCEEVAHLATYLLSDAADYVTGTTVYIDGAASLWGSVWELGW